MAIIRIGVGCNVGAQIDGSQYGALVAATWIKKPDIMIMQDRSLGDQDHYLYMIKDVISRLQSNVNEVLNNGDFPLIIGGDHSIVMGSLPHKQDTLVVWIDAHADVNTPETSITSRIHGMPLAALMGYGDKRLLEVINKPYLKPEQVVYFGIRALDQKEKEFIKNHDMMVLDHHQDIETTIQKLNKKASMFSKIHISFDLDSFDPKWVPGVSTPAKDGIDLHQAKSMLHALFETGKVTSMDIVEFNPLIETRTTVKVLKQIVDIVEGYQQ